MESTKLPIAVIGAGPVGLAAAAHIVERGETPIIFEAAPKVAGGVRSWAHVPTFSPWKYNVDKAAVAILEATGWQMPEADKLPTGAELIDDYLQPLANTPQIEPHLHLGHKVTAISRRRIDKMKDFGRNDAPFIIQTQSAAGEQRFWRAPSSTPAARGPHPTLSGRMACPHSAKLPTKTKSFMAYPTSSDAIQSGTSTGASPLLVVVTLPSTPFLSLTISKRRTPTPALCGCYARPT